MKEFIIFVCTDSTEIFFSKLRSAGLNYNLPSFFTDSFCAGVSNEHCLLTFFISTMKTLKISLNYWWKFNNECFSKDSGLTRLMSKLTLVLMGQFVLSCTVG